MIKTVYQRKYLSEYIIPTLIALTINIKVPDDTDLNLINSPNPSKKYELNKNKYEDVPLSKKTNNKVVSTENKRYGIKLLVKTFKRRYRYFQIKLLTKRKFIYSK